MGDDDSDRDDCNSHLPRKRPAPRTPSVSMSQTTKTATTTMAPSSDDDNQKRSSNKRLCDQHLIPKNYISQLILEMEDAILKLLDEDNDNTTHKDGERRRQLMSEQLTISKLEQMAIFIYESMSMSTRNYHSVQHIFDISEQLDDPIAILAACFHDCIYYHVDGGLTAVQLQLLSGTYGTTSTDTAANANDGFGSNGNKMHDLHRTGYTFRATSGTMEEINDDSAAQQEGDNSLGKPPKHMLLLQIVESIFGYQPDEVIHVGKGLNEFLSAVIAVRLLSDLLSVEQLAQIACCIEATIPFRPADPLTGKTHMESLYDRMVSTAEKFKLNDLLLPTNEDDHDERRFSEIIKCIQRACILSNSDVGNFGTTDRCWFLDNTWSLLPETNESLRNQFVYSVQQFHHAMKKMYDFFGFLQPEVVFHQYQNVPNQDDLDRMIDECRKNLRFGKTYVAAKLLAMSLVAALAVLTGGDEAPLSLFTGDLASYSRHHQRQEDVPDQDANHLLASTLESKQQQLNQQHQRVSTVREERASSFSNKPRRASLIKHQSHHRMPQPPTSTLQKCTPIVYEILSEGRRSKTSFDTRKSPWAAYLYGSLGDDGLNVLLQLDTKDNPLLYPMTNNPDRARKLLKLLPIKAVKVIAKDIEDAAISRADLIRRIVSELEADAPDARYFDSTGKTESESPKR